MRYCTTILIFFICALAAYAGVTMYEFTSVDWTSTVGATKCDGKTDGWVNDGSASAYSEGRIWADGALHSAGASVQTGASGAGATSVKSFTAVRRVKVNFCQNSSKGRGTIYVQVGEGQPDSIVVTKPASGTGELNRDSLIRLTTPATGKIRFWVNVTENAIHIHSITIYAEEGGSTPFTMSTYQLVTDAAQLRDSDQIIIGVAKEGVNKIMGYFDEVISQNNIHAISGRYSADRTTVGANDNAIYTLRKGMTEGKSPREAWYIQDELRYEEAYLVASGGQTKNRLALWNKRYDQKTYGDYGYWDITVASDGAATIMNLGNSAGKYLQYNATNSPTLFGCYSEPSGQTPVAIYREVKALGDVDTIVAPMVNFGDVVLRENIVESRRTIEVQANRLTEDIAVSLKHGEVFAVRESELDRDGDLLTITLSATEAGHYLDTLVLKSGEHVCETPVMANVVRSMTIDEAKQHADFATVYLNDVVVTKKFDKHIFVRDTTGSMLIFDNGDGTGKRYGSKVEAGDVLQGVTGKYRNYFGVPEILPTAAWTEGKPVKVLPDTVTRIDSADVCRYVYLDSVRIDDEGYIHMEDTVVGVYDEFDVGGEVGVLCSLSAIVYISWNEVQLWLVEQTIHRQTDVQEVKTEGVQRVGCYDLLGRKVDARYQGVMIRDGEKIVNW